MGFDTIIKNGSVVTATDTYVADIAIADGKIAAIGSHLGSENANKILDASGKLVLPGGIDVHTHLDMPFGGTTSADDFETGTRAAAFGAATTALAAGLGAYLVFFRRQCLTWGAQPDEVSRRLPGDELLPGAGIVATRAITIDAPPAAIWPWLVQMGSGRGGVYTYDWIENLFGLDMRSARRILPQYQGVKVGDEFPLGPGRPAMRIAVLDPERTFTLRFADGNWVWIFALSAEDGHTRLISRNRIAAAGAWPARLFGMLVMEPGSLIMERKMLLGVKERAEDLARQQSA